MRPIARLGTLLTLLLAPTLLQAQDGFMLGPPHGTLSLRLGQARPTAGGELFESMRRNLTVQEGAFNGEAVAVDLFFRASEHVDVGVSLGWSRGSTRSEPLTPEGDTLVYEDGSPIVQRTTLRRIPATLGVRIYPLKRGDAVGSYAWVPRRLTPFIGGGGGLHWYRLRQAGDFVDENWSIFEDEYVTSGVAMASHLLAGLDYWVSPRIGLVAEGRYTWSSATPDPTFDFDSIDLSGFQATAGLSFRF